ncbi:AbrB family transcriptional regulator [Clostridia bacterium]|nr:AbrB family transcriptional regulator [Clostridia bacterium]
MKNTGITRKVDELGRIVLPMELRRLLQINVKDEIEIFTEDGKIILKKAKTSCVFCGSNNDLTEFKGNVVCGDCVKQLKK